MMKFDCKSYVAFFLLINVGISPCVAQEATNTTSSASNTQPTTKSHVKKTMIYGADQPLWKRYISGGEQSFKSGDTVKAKQYYFGALTELEKQKNPKHQMNSAIARLEHDIMKMYPEPADSKDQTEAQTKTDEEAMSVMQRLNKLNKIYPNTNNLIDAVISTQYAHEKERVAEAKKAATAAAKDQQSGSSQNSK